MAYDTYETKAPWILFRYMRPDWLATCIGGKVRMLCKICGSIRLVYFWPWEIWLAGWNVRRRGDRMHPVRANFLVEHYHSKENKNPAGWALPLGNLEGFRNWREETRRVHGLSST